MAAPTVVERNSEYWVVGGAEVGPFRSHEEAWAWIDRNTDEGRADTDRYNRIRIALAGDGGAPAKNSRRRDAQADDGAQGHDKLTAPGS